jgi:hypothetical protein
MGVVGRLEEERAEERGDQTGRLAERRHRVAGAADIMRAVIVAVTRRLALVAHLRVAHFAGRALGVESVKALCRALIVTAVVATHAEAADIVAAALAAGGVAALGVADHRAEIRSADDFETRDTVVVAGAVDRAKVAATSAEASSGVACAAVAGRVTADVVALAVADVRL